MVANAYDFRLGPPRIRGLNSLSFQEEVTTAGAVPGYRFVPSKDAFGSPSRVESQQCFCPAGPPCAPEGTFNASLCQYESPVLLSFPHFYLGKIEHLEHACKLCSERVNGRQLC